MSTVKNLLQKGAITLAGSSIVSVATLATAQAAPYEGIESGAGVTKGVGQQDDLVANIRTVTNTMLFAIGIVAVIMLIIGGFRYIFSAGKSADVTAAKDTILYAVIGIVVALLAFAIVNFVLGQFQA